jgi:hypothetical protein
MGVRKKDISKLLNSGLDPDEVEELLDDEATARMIERRLRLKEREVRKPAPIAQKRSIDRGPQEPF